jgi:hypothetical protein
MNDAAGRLAEAIRAAAVAAFAIPENLVRNIDGISPPEPSAVVIPIDY